MFLFGCEKGISGQIKGNLYLLDNAPENMEISLGFDKDEPKFYGQAVNNYFGSYSLNDNKIKFSMVGSTMMAAPEPMMKAENEYFNSLGEMTNIRLENGRLILSGDNKELVFRSTKE